jgi:hypothetical protein
MIPNNNVDNNQQFLQEESADDDQQHLLLEEHDATTKLDNNTTRVNKLFGGSPLGCCNPRVAAYTLAGIIIFGLIGYFAIGLPVVTHYAQTKLDQATLEIDSVWVTNPSDDTVDLHANARVLGFKRDHRQLFVKMYAQSFELSLNLPGATTFGSLQTPEVQLVTDGSEFGMVSTIQVTNRTEFDQFLRVTFQNKSVETKVLSHRVQLGVGLWGSTWMKIHVTFNHMVAHATGCNSFNNRADVIDFVPDVETMLEKDARARIGIQIVNPSNISVYPLGDYFEIQLIYKGFNIGSALADEPSQILPGRSTIHCNVTLNDGALWTEEVQELLWNYELGIVSVAEAKFDAHPTGVSLYNNGLRGMSVRTIFDPSKLAARYNISHWLKPRPFQSNILSE